MKKEDGRLRTEAQTAMSAPRCAADIPVCHSNDYIADALAIVVFFSIALHICGCVAGNKAEVSAVKFEKQSTASEVDQYVNTAGRIIDRLTRKDAEK